jgi:hypothetical protein
MKETSKRSPSRTPGPWWFNHYASGSMQMFNVYAGKDADTLRTIVSYQVFAWDVKHQNDKGTIAEWERKEADARLIAAAPEMLDALEHITQSMQHLADTNRLPEGYMSQIRHGQSTLDKARRAIAKACGENTELAA